METKDFGFIYKGENIPLRIDLDNLKLSGGYMDRLERIKKIVESENPKVGSHFRAGDEYS